jgi:ferredoxin
VADNEPAATELWLGLNRKYAELWPNIVSKKEPLPDADEMNGRADKIAEFLSEPAPAEDQAA